MLARKGLLAGAFLLVFSAIAVWAFVATPRYESTARLRIQDRNATPSVPADLQSLPGAGLLGLGRDELETEIGVLRSRRIVDATIDSLALMVRVTDPPASRAAVIAARVVDASEAEGTLTLVRGGDGRYAVSASGFEKAAPPVTVPSAPLAPGDSFRVGPAMLTLARASAGDGPARATIEIVPRFEVRELLDKRLLVSRQEGGSRLVEVRYEDPDRELAQRVVARVVAEYVGYTVETEKTDDVGTVGDLRHQVDSSARRLAASETALREFAERTALVAPEEQATQQVKRIAVINAQLDALGVERAALQRLLALVQGRATTTDTRAYRQLATFPSLISNRGIQDLLLALIDLGNKRSELAVLRTAENDELRQVITRIGELEQQLFRLSTQYLEGLDQQVATASAAVTTLTDTLRAMPAAEAEYTRLARNRGIASTEYLLMRKQLKEAELVDALRRDRIRVVDAPVVADADDPAFPRKAVMLALGLVLAGAVALAAALTAELMAAPARG